MPRPATKFLLKKVTPATKRGVTYVYQKSALAPVPKGKIRVANKDGGLYVRKALIGEAPGAPGWGDNKPGWLGRRAEMMRKAKQSRRMTMGRET